MISTQGNELSCGSTMSRLTQRVMKGRGDSVPTPRVCAHASMPHINKAAPPIARAVASAILPREIPLLPRGASVSKPSKTMASRGMVPT